MNDVEINALLEALNLLHPQFDELSEKLSEAARNLRDPGILPGQELTEQLLAVRISFDRLIHDTTKLASQTPGQQLLGALHPPTLTGIATVLNRISELHTALEGSKHTLDKAIAVIERVLSLVHRDRSDFQPLLDCQASARQLCAIIEAILLPDLHPEATNLANASHPLANLLELADNISGLDDAKADHLHEIVAGTFGNSLANAAIRGKLVEVTPTPPAPEDDSPNTMTALDGIDASPHTPELTETPPYQSVSQTANVQADEAPSESGLVAEKDSGSTSTPNIDNEEVKAETKSYEDLVTATSKELSHPEDVVRIQDVVDTYAEMEAADEPIRTMRSAENTAPSESSGSGIPDLTSTTLGSRGGGERAEVVANSLPGEVAHVAILATVGSEPRSHDVAAQLLLVTDQVNPEDLNLLIWKLIEEDRVSLAYHFVRLCEEKFVGADTILPAKLLHALVLSRHVRYGIGALAAQLKVDFDAISPANFVTGNRFWTDGTTLLLQAAALQPSIVAPSTSAWHKIHELSELDLPELSGVNSFGQYCNIIAGWGSDGFPLDPATLRGVESLEAWHQEISLFYDELEGWISQAPLRTMAYSPATKVWQQWQKPGGLINRFLQPIKDRDESRADFVKQEGLRLSDHSELVAEVNRTDREILGRHGRESIGYKALDQLQYQTEQAVRLAERWLGLLASKPDSSQTYYDRLLQSTRQKARDLYPASMLEFDEVVSTESNYPLELRAGAQACRRALHDVHELLCGVHQPPDREIEAKYLLNAVLLAEPVLNLDEDWEPCSGLNETLPALLRLAATNEVDWQGAFKAYSSISDHEGTARIIEYLRQMPNSIVSTTLLEEQREKYLDDARRKLQRKLQQVGEQVEGAVARGLFREDERSNYVAAIKSIEQRLLNIVRVSEELDNIRRIEDEIRYRQKAQIGAVRRRAQSAGIVPGHEAFDRIVQVLEQGDPLIANEYIDMVLTGSPLPQPGTSFDPFLTFFPALAGEIDRFLAKDFNERRAVLELRKHSPETVGDHKLGPVELQGVSAEQAKQVAGLLEAWFALKKMRRSDVDQLHLVLDGLGFRTIELTPVLGTTFTWTQLTTEIVSNRDLCSVWQYGSGAQGRYRLVCIWDEPTVQDLLDEIGDTSRGEPIIVFWFGRILEQKRRELARLSRERRRTFIVIDDTLLLFLCRHPSPRLPVMFSCTLPFTHLQPYTTTASVVPPETFYGRRIEREKIVYAHGTCFIYGGRQLGKTALLRDVERNYHDPKAGFIALWIDLKVEGIGLGRSIDEIWNLLAQKLKKCGVIPANVPDHSNASTIIEHIEGWLQEENTRRILLLLDEADLFLEADGKQRGSEFQHASRIKGLMDRTNRRFKAVFAGLHNVQRTTRQANHPLAHYSTAICVGPLLEDGEWREARALIEEPLATVGFRFESPDLVTLILSQTNYFPSLIQLYCAQLLEHIRSSTKIQFDPRTSPPFVISAKHVNDVSSDDRLGKEVRSRFDLTLDLDRRYEVLALAVAHASLDDDGRSLVRGFSVEWLRSAAVEWWEEGFRSSSSEDDIRALADEMVGLGVLRVTEGDTYALRSPNVLLLMGTKKQIGTRLLREREAPIEYEPSTFRAAFRHSDPQQTVDPARRSPLSAQQVSQLRSRTNGVSVIFGNTAAGIRDLDPFLQLAFGPEYFISIDKARSIEAFSKDLGALLRREEQGTTILLVSQQCPWTLEWLDLAIQAVERLRSKSSFARIAFVADPSTTWTLLSESREAVVELSTRGVTSFSLRPFHDTAVRQWLDDIGFGSLNQQDRTRIRDVTGNWAWLLRRFYDECNAEFARWREVLFLLEESARHPENANELLSTFGVTGQDRRSVLRTMAVMQDAIAPEDLVDLASPIPSDQVHRILEWADRLSLIMPAANNSWRIDPVLSKALEVAVE